MDIIKTQEAGRAILAVSGRLDTVTAPRLEAVSLECLSDGSALVMDFKDLVYVSSAGLRVLLSTHKKTLDRGGLVLRNVHDEILELLDMTGFIDVLTIER